MGTRGRKSGAELAMMPHKPPPMVPRIVEPPRPLSAPGRAVWDRMVAAYDFGDPAGAEILAQACQAVDLAESTEDPKLELQARAFVARILGRLCE